MVGEIYLANIYFTNATASKVRPNLLLKPNRFGDILYLPLTSNTGTNGIRIDNSHLKDGYLPKASVIVYEKVGVIDPVLLIRKIATLNQGTYQQVTSSLIQFLQT